MIGDLEIILPLRVVPQPKPELWNGGDCGACVLAGLTGLTVEEIYKVKENVRAFCHPTMVSTLGRLYWDGHLDRLVTKVPYWSSSDAFRIFGDPAVIQGDHWFAWMTMALEAGYYGLMHYRFDGDPTQLPDHFVMVCGAKIWHDPIPGKVNAEGKPNGWTLRKELLISCSSTRSEPEFWLSIEELFSKRGGFNVMLARPTIRRMGECSPAVK